MPPMGCANPVAKEANGSTAACAGLTRAAVPTVVAARLSALMTGVPLANRVMNGNELRAVRKGRLHLHLGDHLRDTFHDLIAPQNLAALRRELRHRFPVACSFQNEVR